MSRTSVMTQKLVLAALFAALLAVSGQLSIPIGPVPITLQTLVVMLTGAILGARWGAASVFVWILLAAVGVPVLSGGSGGLAALFGPTGGYIFGFLISSFVIGLVIHRFHLVKFWKLLIVFLLGGTLLINLVGFPWLLIVSHLAFSTTIFNQAFVVFLPGDIVKAILAALLAVSLFKASPQLIPQSPKKTKST